jgi:hypothetical protein
MKPTRTSPTRNSRRTDSLIRASCRSNQGVCVPLGGRPSSSSGPARRPLPNASPARSGRSSGSSSGWANSVPHQRMEPHTRDGPAARVIAGWGAPDRARPRPGRPTASANGSRTTRPPVSRHAAAAPGLKGTSLLASATFMVMSEDQSIDMDALRARFPWIGLADLDQPDLSSRYREIMAESHRNSEIVEAIESVRHSA